jgi:hypothetical protein
MDRYVPDFEDFYETKNEEVEETLEDINETFFDSITPLLRIIKLYLQDSHQLTKDELLDLRTHLLDVRRFCEWYFIEIDKLLEDEDDLDEETVFHIIEEEKSKKRLCARYNQHLDWVENHLRVLRDMERRRSMKRGSKV